MIDGNRKPTDNNSFTGVNTWRERMVWKWSLRLIRLLERCAFPGIGIEISLQLI